MIKPNTASCLAASWTCAAVVALTVVSVSGHLRAQSGELRVLSSSNMQPILADLKEPFERATGHRLAVTIAEAVPVRDRILAGEGADVVITQRSLLDDTVAQRKVDPKTVIDIARSTVSVVVKAGAASPDITSVEAFRRALAAAPSLAYPDPKAGGLAGIYLAKAIEEMGMTSQLAPKTTLAASGQEACRLVASGQVTLGVAQTSTARSVAGVAVIGTLPRELGVDIVVGAGIVATTGQRAASETLLGFLKSPAAAAIIRTRGMEP